MPSGIRPRVNEAREFLEIAKDFKNPKELIREALSNSWDAGATCVSLRFDLRRIQGTKAKKIVVEIEDDGEGMSDMLRPEFGTSELEDFFNLGDSHKPQGSIGTKGHGTKIYYKSAGISLDTWKNGRHIHAASEDPPWDTLQSGIVPRYGYEVDDTPGKGTKIVVDGFIAKQAEFADTESLVRYISWFTIAGGFGAYFGAGRTFGVKVKPTSMSAPIFLERGLVLPEENLDVSSGTDDYCRVLGPETLDCGVAGDGAPVQVQVVGAVLGEGRRDFVPHTYGMMGLWLGKDYMRIERNNDVIDKVFGGQYWYRNMLVLANCQQFDLTANRNNVRTDQEEYEQAIAGVQKFLVAVKNDKRTEEYFEAKKREDEAKDLRQKQEESERKRDQLAEKLNKRLNELKGRASLLAVGLQSPPLKEPQNESETALLLQAMISSHHPGIDFSIGDYNTHEGPDMLAFCTRKQIDKHYWVELVHHLVDLCAWSHPKEGIEMVVCWARGDVGEELQLHDGRKAKLHEKTPGRLSLDIGEDTLEVYVLSELLIHHATKQTH